jgi:predicted site-specific integrase-resolvase
MKKKTRIHSTGNGILMTESELARELGVSPRTIRSWRYKGFIPCIKLGYRTLKFRLPTVLDALQRRERKPINLGAAPR